MSGKSEHWKTKPLGELTSLMVKGIPPAYANVSGNHTVYVLNQKCNRDFSISYAQARLHDLSKKKIPDERFLRPGDVIINSTGTGTAGRIAQIWDIPSPTTIDGHMILMRPTDEIDPLYYGYALKAQQNRMQSFEEGSTGQTEINRKRFCDEVMIRYPSDVRKQKAIAAILFALDEKVSLNTRINDNLSKQARAIFERWFIENPASDNWDLGVFSELITKTVSGDWGKDTPHGNNSEMVYCIRGADIPDVRTGNKGKMPIRYILPKNYSNPNND